jgi:hypothetical protein
MTTRLGHAQGVRQILKPRSASPPSISPYFGSQSLRRTHDSRRSRIFPLYHQKPLLLRRCSFHHHLPVLASAMSSDKTTDHYRLPRDLCPRHYDLTIRTDLENEKFSGFVKIECAYSHLSRIVALSVSSLDILNATKVVTFNAAAELNLDSASLVIPSSAAELAPVEIKFDAYTQRVSLVFVEELPVGSKAILRIGFEAALTDSMTGYYKSMWQRGIYALTQFEVRE